MKMECLSLVYKNLRDIMKELQSETGAKMVITLSSEEDFDEGIFVLKGMDKIIEKYDVKDANITYTPGGVYRKAEFSLFDVKFMGYLRKSEVRA